MDVGDPLQVSRDLAVEVALGGFTNGQSNYTEPVLAQRGRLRGVGWAKETKMVVYV